MFSIAPLQSLGDPIGDLAHALAGSPRAVMVDWRFDPVEVLESLGHLIREADSSIVVEVVSGTLGERQIARGKGKKRQYYRWRDCKECHDLVFSLSQLIEPEVTIYGIRPLEGDTEHYLVASKSEWSGIQQILGDEFRSLFFQKEPSVKIFEELEKKAP
jgi:hypothetical protein